MSVLFSKTEADLSIWDIGESRGSIMVKTKLSCRLKLAVS